MDTSEPVIIARASTESEASVIKSLLESYGIPCHYSSELPSRFYPVPDGGAGPIRVSVPGALSREAESILAEHRRRESPLRPVND